jgi:hypothetical protein
MAVMTLLATYVVLLAAHFLADFVLQSDRQARGKSVAIPPLLEHVGAYTAVIGVAAIVLLGIAGVAFAIVNGALHFATDFITSRWSARLDAAGRRHGFFIVVGFDQLVHQTTLAATLVLMVA